MNEEELAICAQQAMQKAYAPYSHFFVGAALLTASGRVYTGANIENASYGASICAERSAFAKAVSDGEREFVGIAICGGSQGKITKACLPCGICRQVMSEFCDSHFEVILVEEKGLKIYSLGELFPEAFALEEGDEG